MSIKAMVYVWQTPYKGAQKLMLLAIADRCDDEGTCYPGVASLAAKCSVKQRAAQALITELEKNGELTVQIGAGIETGRGKTNRYFMKKYRETLGLKTPVHGTRVQQITPTGDGVQKSASLRNGVQNFTSQDMQKSASQGVQDSAFNTSEYSSVDTSEKEIASATQDAPDQWPVDERKVGFPFNGDNTNAPAPTKAKGKTKNTATTPPPPTPSPAARLAQALGVTPVGDDWAFYGGIAKKLLKAKEITADDFEGYVAFVKNMSTREKWNFTASSLTGVGRLSLYVTWRDHNQDFQRRAKAALIAEYGRDVTIEPDPKDYIKGQELSDYIAMAATLGIKVEPQ